jgi:hypothetical protein
MMVGGPASEEPTSEPPLALPSPVWLARVRFYRSVAAITGLCGLCEFLVSLFRFRSGGSW